MSGATTVHLSCMTLLHVLAAPIFTQPAYRTTTDATYMRSAHPHSLPNGSTDGFLSRTPCPSPCPSPSPSLGQNQSKSQSFSLSPSLILSLYLSLSLWFLWLSQSPTCCLIRSPSLRPISPSKGHKAKPMPVPYGSGEGHRGPPCQAMECI